MKRQGQKRVFASRQAGALPVDVDPGCKTNICQVVQGIASRATCVLRVLRHGHTNDLHLCVQTSNMIWSL